MTRSFWRRAAFTASAAALLTGCDARLPDPESPGARLYAQRCSGCHRLYAPSLMKGEMWTITLDRMQGEMARRGAQPLSKDEYAALTAYLRQHAAP